MQFILQANVQDMFAVILCSFFNVFFFKLFSADFLCGYDGMAKMISPPFTGQTDCAGWRRECPDFRQWSGKFRRVLRWDSFRSAESWKVPVESDCWERREEPNGKFPQPPGVDPQ